MIALRSFLVVVLLFSVVGSARADHHGMPLRSFDRFEFDSESANGLWAELLGDYTDFDNVEVTTYAARVAAGGEMGELGLVLPYVDVDTPAGDANGLGDLEAYGKWIGHGELLDGGVGLAVTFPTGDEDEGLSTDEYGFVPFGTVGFHLGDAAEVRAHVGYQEFTGDDDDASDSWIYGGGLFGALSEQLALRGEILGQSIDGGGDPVTFEPGVDFRLPMNAADLLFRLNGTVGLTDDAPDWGLGGSIVFAWNQNQ